MAEGKIQRLRGVAAKLNVGTKTILDFLSKEGFEVDDSPNSKITHEQVSLLSREFASSALEKEEASGLSIGTKHTDNILAKPTNEAKSEKDEEEFLIKDNNAKDGKNAEKPGNVDKITAKHTLTKPKVIGKIDLDGKGKSPVPKPGEAPGPEKPAVDSRVSEGEKPQKEGSSKPEENKQAKEKGSKVEKQLEAGGKPEDPATANIEDKPEEKKEASPKGQETISGKADSLKGLTVVGKIDLPPEKKEAKPVASSDQQKDRKKRPRKRINSPQRPNSGNGRQGGRADRPNRIKGKVVKKVEELSEKEIQEKIKSTLAKLSGGKAAGNTGRSKYRKDKRNAKAEAEEEKLLAQQEDAKKLKVTEYISASDLASLMDVSVNKVISTCMSLGMFVSINQRIDAESITVIADEFGYEVEFTSDEDEVEVVEVADKAADLSNRAPIVTIMGHVDHGKTSLLDYIRNSKVTESEAGGITQHIGAYDVTTSGGKRIAFLDTPGHEAFTAMRARGAKITDIAIIVVAADDAVMPQTKEAINHAQVAGVPIVIAINKVDKPNANPEKIKEELSSINVLVEDWGGKYQCQNISAKNGEGIDGLLEKVLLEAEMLELKANADKPAVGTVIEASLDKGRGYVTTMMIQGGTMKIGDVVLAGAHFGKVKAMFDHRGRKLQAVGPSTPVLMLGLNGAAQAGDRFNVMGTDREAREIAIKRGQIQREQSIRTKKHITLDEIGRRLAIGSFKELNVIVKGDVDGSVEALSDSLLNLSTEEVQVKIIHKAVGQISEADILLAGASDAIIIGFQVRPSAQARKIAESEEIEIRLYSIIYDAINDVKDAMEGMLEPTTEEVITGNIEVREVFKISKVGTVAGCYVTDGVVKRSNKVRLIREGIVVYEGAINQLKRFKDDVNEVKQTYECGVSIKSFNDIKVGDVIEGFEEEKVTRTL